MGTQRPWKHQEQPSRPFKSWTPGYRMMVRVNEDDALKDSAHWSQVLHSYGFTWDDQTNALLTCYKDGKPMDQAEAITVLETMADDITASVDNRRVAKRILKAIKAR